MARGKNAKRWDSCNTCPIRLRSPQPTAEAGFDSYQCEVKAELHLEADGSLHPFPHPINLGDRFVVNRNTGQTLGGPFLNGITTRVELVATAAEATVLSQFM